MELCRFSELFGGGEDDDDYNSGVLNAPRPE